MSEIRVDNITDEAGTGAPEIVDHYKKSNILGTVSESGGVPTGAVIERGSNSNGEYVKFADGTLIMNRTVSVNLNNDGPVQSLFDYPISSYTGVSVATGSPTRGTGNRDNADGLARVTVWPDDSNTCWRVLVGQVESASGSPAGSSPVSLIAIARWY